MPDIDARAIANEFIRLAGDNFTRSGFDPAIIGQMWVQKLVYMAHGWTLAITKAPLVRDEIEAWDAGPVFRSIWNHFRDYGRDKKTGLLSEPDGDPLVAKLSADERSVIDHVWKRYGRYTGRKLSEITHQPGTPWTNAYFRRGRNSLLSNTDIENHFTELALDGRKKQQKKN